MYVPIRVEKYVVKSGSESMPSNQTPKWESKPIFGLVKLKYR